MTLIELGEVSPGSSPPQPALRRIDARRMAVTVVAALCLLMVTGSERPEPRGLPTLWTIPYRADQFALTGDALYLLEPDAAALTAYDPADGSLRWSRRLAERVGWLSTELPGLVLMAVVADERIEDNGSVHILPVVQETVALEPATGTERWRQRGEPSLGTAETVMLVEWDHRGGGGTEHLRMVRTTDGMVMWEHKPGDGTISWTTTGADRTRPERFITATGDGRVEVRRFADGALVTAGTLPWLTVSERQDHASVYGAAGHLFTLRTQAGRQTVTAYDVDTLRQRWQRTISLGSGIGMFDCGPLVCFGDEEQRVDGIDPATGTVLWRGQGWDYAQPLAGGRLLVQSGETGRHGVVDQITGRMLADFGMGVIVTDRAGREVLNLRPTASPPLLFAVHQLAADDEVILRGAIGSTGELGCQLEAGRLVWFQSSGRLVVTDVG